MIFQPVDDVLPDGDDVEWSWMTMKMNQLIAAQSKVDQQVRREPSLARDPCFPPTDPHHLHVFVVVVVALIIAIDIVIADALIIVIDNDIVVALVIVIVIVGGHLGSKEQGRILCRQLQPPRPQQGSCGWNNLLFLIF